MSDRRPSAARCLLCGAPRSPEFRPFCSRRCRNVDLNRWLTGAYAVPAVEDEDEPDEGGPAEGPGQETGGR